MGYPQACHFLGKEPKGGSGKQFLYGTPRMPKKTVPFKFTPAQLCEIRLQMVVKSISYA
jgi:hypothetical protein